MLLEKILFNVVAISFVVVIFIKIIKKNDTNYFGILLLELFGIAVCFFELNLGVNSNAFFLGLRYLFSVFIPFGVIFLEIKNINFSEVISVIKANIFYYFGSNKKAKEELNSLVSKYENSYYGHKLLAEIYEKEGGMRKSIDEYVKAVDIRKNDHKSYFKIARLLNELDKKDEAIDMLQTLLKNQPDLYDASILLGEMYCEQERFKEAATVYQDALKYKSFDFELYYNLGIVYTRLNDFSQAKEMYEKAAEINHLLYGAYYNLALIALIQKELDQAEQYFEKCLYEEELEPMAYYNLAKISVIKGDKSKAINFLNQAINLDYSLLNKALNDRVFEYIKQYIAVSAKMDEDPKKEKKIKSKLDIRAEIARIYLENTNDLVDNIKENTNKQKLEEKLKLLIDSERLRNEQKQEELAEKEQQEEKNEKQEEQEKKQKEISDSNNE